MAGGLPSPASGGKKFRWAKSSCCGLKKKTTKKRGRKGKRKCKHGVNKVTKKCLKHPRKRR